jgi:antitoxin component YwqK of YwqJK toxin-antitoxin module
MSKLRSLLILLFYFSVICGSNAQSVDWQQQVRDIMIKYKDSVVKAQILLLNENIKTSNNLTYYWYKNDAINTNMGGYSGDLLHGEYQVYSLDRKLITQGFFEHGLKNGTWKYWNTKGLLKQTIEYREGQLNGELIRYDTKGIQIEKKKYKDGILQPESTGKIKIFKGDNKNKEQPIDSVINDSAK